MWREKDCILARLDVVCGGFVHCNHAQKCYCVGLTRILLRCCSQSTPLGSSSIILLALAALYLVDDRGASAFHRLTKNISADARRWESHCISSLLFSPLHTMTRRLLLAYAIAAAAAAAPLHASFAMEEAGMAPPRRGDTGDNHLHHRRHRRRRRRRRTRRRRADGPTREEDDERRSLRPEFAEESSSSTSSFNGVEYDPAIQTRLPLDALPHIGSTGSSKNHHNIFSSSTTNSNSGINMLIEPRIINGQTTIPGRHPYASSLLDTSTSAHICGGTLIAPDIILTAGHCSGYFDSIQVGMHDLKNPRGDGTYPMKFDHLIVEKHQAHPKYGNVIFNDLAVAKLYGTSEVPPVRINNRRNVPDVNDALTVMGWGVTEEGNSATSSTELRGVDVLSWLPAHSYCSANPYKDWFLTSIWT